MAEPTGGTGSMGLLGWAQAASAIGDAYSSIESGRIARIQAERERMFRQFEAEQAEIIAGREIAASQRVAAEERRQSELVASRALAVAASSGAGVTDPTVVRLIAQTKGEGVYRANLALYEGETRARQLRLQAVGLNIEGSNAILEGDTRDMAYRARGRSSVIRTAGSLFARYGGEGPSSKPPTGESEFISDYTSEVY